MRNSQIALLLLIAHIISELSPLRAYAQTAPPCEVIAWPYKQKAEEIKIEHLSILSREAIYSYLFFELGQPRANRMPGLAGKLLDFLRGTELNHERAMFLEALSAATTGLQVNNTVPPKELCSLYRSTFLEDQRTPNSVRAKRTQEPAKRRKQEK